ncbi:hypothetical protein EUGRSUZ_I01603 [Eucalyptus grandis]|uniref:Uncharacterized protein n=2 Tax=Eucalyptus grandis TaxID=71139 RepID=A0ACC3JFU7_EUCGR|nr:hypothetical protein EUGRSUZ_I01603 [Eucalyptus grandis]
MVKNADRDHIKYASDCGKSSIIYTAISCRCKAQNRILRHYVSEIDSKSVKGAIEPPNLARKGQKLDRSPLIVG